MAIAFTMTFSMTRQQLRTHGEIRTPHIQDMTCIVYNVAIIPISCKDLGKLLLPKKA